MRNLARLGVGALVGVLVLAAAGCGGDNGTGATATATTSAPTTTAADRRVAIVATARIRRGSIGDAIPGPG